ncbi:Prima1 [Columba guinea]|nr:Prima1 [Columba guinea]
MEACLPAEGAGTCWALGFPDHPFPSPPAHLPASLPPPSLPPSLPPSPPELKLGQSRSGDGCEPTPLLPARSAPSPGRPEPAPPPARPGGMLLRELLGLLRCCWPSLLLHCALHPLWGSVQLKFGNASAFPSLSLLTAFALPLLCGLGAEEDYGLLRAVSEAVADQLGRETDPTPKDLAFDVMCSCISPLALQALLAPKSTFCPTEETWWPGLVIIIAVCCATLVFLLVVVIICYKAIKRKPMRKEENGTSRAEYAMTSSQNNKTVDNNAVV